MSVCVALGFPTHSVTQIPLPFPLPRRSPCSTRALSRTTSAPSARRPTPTCAARSCARGWFKSCVKLHTTSTMLLHFYIPNPRRTRGRFKVAPNEYTTLYYFTVHARLVYSGAKLIHYYTVHARPVYSGAKLLYYYTVRARLVHSGAKLLYYYTVRARLVHSEAKLLC